MIQLFEAIAEDQPSYRETLLKATRDTRQHKNVKALRVESSESIFPPYFPQSEQGFPPRLEIESRGLVCICFFSHNLRSALTQQSNWLEESTHSSSH